MYISLLNEKKPSQVKEAIREALKVRMIQSRIQRLMNKVKPVQTRNMHNSSNLNAIVQELRETVSVNKFKIFVKENGNGNTDIFGNNYCIKNVVN